MARILGDCTRIVALNGLTRERRCTQGFDFHARTLIAAPHGQLQSRSGKSVKGRQTTVYARGPPVDQVQNRPKTPQEVTKWTEKVPEVVVPDKQFPKSVVESSESLLSTGSNVHILQHRWDTLNYAFKCYSTNVATGLNLIFKSPNPVGALGQALAREWKIIYLTTCNDFTSTMLPFWSMGISTLAVSPFLQSGDWNHFLPQAATTMSKEVLYSFLFLYCFNLSNQYKGVRADLIDKPWRPIPSGLLTRETALARCFLANLFYAFVSWHLGLLPWSLFWQCVVFGQFFGLEKDTASRGLGRSISMFAGTIVMGTAGVSLATPMTSTLQVWAVLRAAMAGNHHWMQDFRDVEGDERVGRITFPLLFGVENARKLMATIFLMDPIFLHFGVMKDSSYSEPQLILEGLALLLSVTLAYRVLNYKTPAQDHLTFMGLVTFWHNLAFMLVGPAFLAGVNVSF